jgi:hypothetical protein
MVIRRVPIAEPDFELPRDRQQHGHGKVEPLGLDPNGPETGAGGAHTANRSSAAPPMS